MADGKVFTGKTRQGAGLVVSTGILGDFVLPNGGQKAQQCGIVR
jgi:hypothetical protein